MKLRPITILPPLIPLGTGGFVFVAELLCNFGAAFFGTCFVGGFCYEILGCGAIGVDVDFIVL